MPLTTVVAGQTISASVANANWANAVSIDTARTISVTHTWSAAQTFGAGARFNAGFAFGEAPTAYNLIRCTGTPTLTGDVSPAGMVLQPTVDSGASTDATVVALRLKTAAGSYTIPAAYTLAITDVSLGASSAVTTHYGLWIGDLTSAGTDWAIYTNAGGVRLGGTTYINDTSNAKATLGLTINQGANDDEIFALKSSDVAHGMTDLSETDTYLTIVKIDGDTGGGRIRGYSDAGVGYALQMSGIAGAVNTAKTTSARSPVEVDAMIANGANKQAPTADGNLLTIMANGTTRFIHDTEGSAHADVEWTTF